MERIMMDIGTKKNIKSTKKTEKDNQNQYQRIEKPTKYEFS